jgi:hypothetical protein
LRIDDHDLAALAQPLADLSGLGRGLQPPTRSPSNGL